MSPAPKDCCLEVLEVAGRWDHGRGFPVQD